STDPAYDFYGVFVNMCRTGITYQSNNPVRPNIDFKSGGDNCPRGKVSSSASVQLAEYPQALSSISTPEGDTMRFQVGMGTTTWTNFDTNTPQSLTCDVEHTCYLVVEVGAGDPATATFEPWAFDITYRNDDVVDVCGGQADGVVASG